MRDGSTLRRHTSQSPTNWNQKILHLARWRDDDRFEDVRALALSARGLTWSRAVLDALLDELHVSDDFDVLVGRVAHLPTNQYTTLGCRRAASATQLVSAGHRANGHTTWTVAPDPPDLGIPNNTSRRRPPPSRSSADAVSKAPHPLKGAHMSNESISPFASTRGHRVRELVCAYRPLRDGDGRVVDVPTVVLKDPRTAASVLAPLIADQPVEVFAVACLSTKYRLLAWHVVSRGTRDSAPVSMPDVFVPACLTPGTTGLMVVHNHPSGDPTPSPDDARLTLRLCAAADVLDLPLLDHLIVGDAHRYYSFREAGLMEARQSRQ